MNQPLLLERIGSFKRGIEMKRAYYIGDNTFQLERLFAEVHIGKSENIEKADIVVFGGGADIDPAMYDEKINVKARTSISRREDERDDAAWKKVKPQQLKVGICRG